jgi:hypothetical protein
MGHFMFDTSTTALLRAVLNEVCESDVRARTHVASRILEAATGGDMSPESLKQSDGKLSRKRRPCGADRTRGRG